MTDALSSIVRRTDRRPLWLARSLRASAVAFALASAFAALTASPVTVAAQAGRGQTAAVQSDRFHTVYVRLGGGDEGLLYEPSTPGPNARIALVYSHPGGNNFYHATGRELAARGYRALMVNHHGAQASYDVYAPGLSRGIEYLRTLPGVQRVVIVGHSGGGELMAFYGNVAEHGPSGCQGPEKLYPCRAAAVTGLAKPDGVVLIDSPLGAFHRMHAIDPATEDGRTRIPALDMFAAANGYVAGKQATYSAEFAKRFYAAQAARNARIVDQALERLHALDAKTSPYTDDEPLVIRGAGDGMAGARLYQPDPHYFARTKKPHLLLKADGSQAEVIVPSVRQPWMQYAGGLGSLGTMTQNTTVRTFLAMTAIRTTPDYAITADDVVGVNWQSSFAATPANAEGISVPSLVMVMTCHYNIVPGEIIFDHLASKDKTYVAIEGALHEFAPCKPEYGDTEKRLFDFLDGWLRKPGRF